MLIPARIIEKKRDRKELTPDEIRGFIRGAADGSVADYQITAFLMAVYLNGMSVGETVALTIAMLESGERYDLSGIPAPKVDKHSTGGVGDKTSLILAPLAAACGVCVPMMSGRGLGHSGGTLDKLEAIRGFDVRLSRPRFEAVLRELGCAMIGQSDTIAPADKKLYALRDVTGTVECIPLIVASILSKKLAEGTDALILDVKAGSGAFMKTAAQARTLARALILVGKKLGLRCRALVTSMEQPLGYAVGHSLEVIECIEILKNGTKTGTYLPGELTSCDLRELTLQLCAQMLEASKAVPSLAAGRKLAIQKLEDGSAYRTFENLVRAQDGSLEQVHAPLQLPLATRTVPLVAKRRGYLARIRTDSVGRMVVGLGGGRKKASDTVDHGVGFIFHKKLGAKVQPGDVIATAYVRDKHDISALEKDFQASLDISANRKAVPKLILDAFTK